MSRRRSPNPSLSVYAQGALSSHADAIESIYSPQTRNDLSALTVITTCNSSPRTNPDSEALHDNGDAYTSAPSSAYVSALSSPYTSATSSRSPHSPPPGYQAAEDRLPHSHTVKTSPGHQHPGNAPQDNSFFLNSRIDNRHGTIQVNASLSGPAVASIVEVLHKYICSRAMFDGDDREDAPKVHPDTRKSIISDIKPWATSIESKEGILWLTGSVGMGKSAIARKVCEDLHKQDPRLLIGSFFFWRNDPERNSIKAFIPTILYRLSMIMPKVGGLVAQAIVRNPSIMNFPLETQWVTLIIEPLRQVFPNAGIAQRALIVIDGLDECQPLSHQQQILRLLPMFSLHGLDRYVAFLVVSRPESHIQSEFSILVHDHPSLFRTPHLVLSETEESREDMRLLLKLTFNDILRRRPQIVGECQWPPENAIKEIIQEAKGHFIYTSTIAKWLLEEDGHPVQRLQAVINFACRQHETHAFASLDALYTLILETACNKESGELVLPCLALFAFSLNMVFQLPPLVWLWAMFDAKSTTLWLRPYTLFMHPATLGKFFQKDCSYIRLLLQPLHSVLKVSDDNHQEIDIYHISFLEYLVNEPRSGVNWLWNKKVQGFLLTQALLLDYEQLECSRDNWAVGTVWLWLPFLKTGMDIEISPRLIDALAQTNAANWLYKQSLQYPLIMHWATRKQYYLFCKWLRSIPLPKKKKVKF
ncbi:hypothetical protein AX16_003381 [Volvariella volvacea WC 439]|nr:hypothetical protein AX16_003381 [Volvariella volvacea WC 439]